MKKAKAKPEPKKAKSNTTTEDDLSTTINSPSPIKTKKSKISMKSNKDVSLSTLNILLHTSIVSVNPFFQAKSTEVKHIKKTRTYDPIKANRGVVYVNHIPHGFYEEQLKKYFAQFGDVTRVRVARSEQSGKSKGHAFVEFRLPEVAEIAAETMDNYIMFKKTLKTVYIPPEKQTHNFFRTKVHVVRDANGEKHVNSPKIRRQQAEVKRINGPVSTEQHLKRVEKSLKKYGLMKPVSICE